MFLRIVVLGIITQLCTHSYASDFPLTQVVVDNEEGSSNTLSTSSDNSQSEASPRHPMPSPRQTVLNINVTRGAQDDHDPLATQNCLNTKFNISLGGFAGMLIGTVAGGIAVPLTNVALAPLYGAATGTVVVPLVLYAIGGIRHCYARYKNINQPADVVDTRIDV
jgi:hypothetical protein